MEKENKSKKFWDYAYDDCDFYLTFLLHYSFPTPTFR